MQKIMDEYAGGIRTDYIYAESGLKLADEKISELTKLLASVTVNDIYDLLALYEVRERLIVARVLIAHLSARKETRRHSFQKNADYPEKSSEICPGNLISVDDESKAYLRRPSDCWSCMAYIKECKQAQFLSFFLLS